MIERWAYINNTFYQVSNRGMIKSPRGRILNPYRDQKGYLRIDIHSHTMRVHRLVCQNFKENPKNLPQVNHIDGDKTNNHDWNLEWVDNETNVAHSVSNGLYDKRDLRGSKNGTSILTEADVKEIRSRFKPRKVTREMLAIEFNVASATIKDVILRKSWNHV